MPEQFNPSQQPELSAASERAERGAVGSEMKMACGDLASECSDTLNETPEGRLQLVCAEAGLSLADKDPNAILENRHLRVAFSRPLPMPPAIRKRCLELLKGELNDVKSSVAEFANPTVTAKAEALQAAVGQETEKGEKSETRVITKTETLATKKEELAVANAVIDDFFQTRVEVGTLSAIRVQIKQELSNNAEITDADKAMEAAEAKYIAPHEARLTAMQAVFTSEEIQRVFGGSLTQTVSLNLRGENNAQIYADVFARIDAGFANDDDRRREVRAAVEVQLGIKAHQSIPKTASEMRDSLNKGYGTETKTEIQRVQDPVTGEWSEQEVVVSEAPIPFSEAFPFVVSHNPHVVMYPKTPGASDYQVKGRVAGMGPVETTVEIPPTGVLPEASIHVAFNKAFIAANFRNAGLNGMLEHLCGRSDAMFGTSADVSAGAIGQTDMLQNVLQMFEGEIPDVRSRFMTGAELTGMQPELRHLTIDGDFGGMNQNDPIKVQNMMRALFGASHGEITGNLSRLRGIINSGGAETPSYQASYTKMYPEDAANGYVRLRGIIGENVMAQMDLGGV